MLSSLVQAQLILHRATVNLIDVVPGADLWEANYSIEGVLPTLDQGFTIFFDAANYRDLSGPITSVGTDWDILIIQPDPGLSAPGLFDALALAPTVLYTGPFTIQFTLLGGGEPGIQAYEVYTLDPSFSILQRGQVGTAAVPEPAILGGATALLLLLIVSRRTLRQRAQNQSIAAA